MDKIEKIKGWVARDDDGTLAIHYEKPRRVCYYNNEIVLDGTPWVWENEAGYGLLPVKIFPDLKWEDEPLEVELAIKRISTLSEEPNKSLEEAAEISFDEADALAKDYVNFLAKGLTENYPRPIGPHWFSEYAKKRFIAGAKWGAEHLRDTTKMIDKSLEEAAEEYTQKMLESWRFDSTGCRPPRESFKAGAEWQAEKCDEETSKLLYAERQTAYINGWDDHKQQMLKDAFVADYVAVDDGRIELEGDPLPCLNPIILLPYPQFQPGDRVKVIVLKEED